MASSPSDTPAPPPPARRVPPPCWSVEETLALIDSYQEKWYSLRRGNLRAHHWQEVADAVALRCPIPSPKTAIQCRHKIEKLRKRYRSESSRRPHPSSSPWPFFRKMDSMERGASPSPARLPSLSASSSPDASSSSGDYPPFPNGKPNPRAPAELVEMRRRVERKRTRESGGGTRPPALDKVAEALGTMCDGFVRMEQMKMDMESEMHRLRMEMELKRTEMMIDSHRRIVEGFLEGIAAGKRSRVPREA